jgi:hypothetical protein
MKKDEMLEVARARDEAVMTEAERERKTRLRSAIEASTARILNIARTRGPADSDPEAA